MTPVKSLHDLVAQYNFPNDNWCELKYFKIQDKLRRYECDSSDSLRCVIRLLFVALFMIDSVNLTVDKIFYQHLKTHSSCLRWRCDKYQDYQMSQLEGTVEQVDIDYLCSNWISMGQFLADWFLPTIRLF